MELANSDDHYSSASSPPDISSYFYSCPASPIHHAFSLPSFSSSDHRESAPPATRTSEVDAAASEAFEFHGRAAVDRDSMISADEIFHNGKIRPLINMSNTTTCKTVSSGLERREQRIQAGSQPTRSMSPIRTLISHWPESEEVEHHRVKVTDREMDLDEKTETGVTIPGATPTIPDSSSDQSSRDSSSSSSSSSTAASRNSGRWTFLKDYFHRSKSDGSDRSDAGIEVKKEKFWHSISFSLSSTTKLKPPEGMNSESKLKSSGAASTSSGMIPGLKKPPSNRLGRRRRAPPALMPPAKPNGQRCTENQEQLPGGLRHRSSLTYGQAFNGCSVFGSWGYSAIHGYVKSLNPLSSR